MKRKEWAILAILTVGVAALEVFGTGGDMPEHAPADGSGQEAARPTDLTGPVDSDSDPMGEHRTVRLHVTGMT